VAAAAWPRYDSDKEDTGKLNMTETEIDYPKRTRELHNALMDSDRWDEFKFRDDDIVIDTWAKSGTTWTQQIVSQLVFQGEVGVPIMDIAPWVDMRCFPLDEVLEHVEAQTHRRFVKTHLPADALLMSPKAKYLFLARDGRDVAWSFYNHLRSHTDEFYEMVNNTPGRVGPPIERPGDDVREFFHDWVEHDGFYDWSYFDHIQSWWDIRDVPNVHLVHFNNLKEDMPGNIRRIAEFLEIDIDEERWPDIVEHCTFDYMKKNADDISPQFKTMFTDGMTNFVFKGTNQRWRDVLSPEEIEKYESIAASRQTADCAHWHATGEMPR
jgi:aryl sulfotransferase